VFLFVAAKNQQCCINISGGYMEQGYLLNDAAKRAGVRGYQIAYALSQGYLPEPKQWFNRQRIFTDEDIARIKEYFANRPKRGKPSLAEKEVR